MTRTRTPDVRRPDGTPTVCMKRYCNGCGLCLGDATGDEINAARNGRRLPDVRTECPTCTPDTTLDRSTR